MPYYNRPMGDYATGGYGRSMGDPGLLSSIWKIVKPIVTKVVLGPVLGPVLGAAAGVAAGKQLVTQPAGPPLPPAAAFPGVGAVQIGAGIGAAAGAGVAAYRGAAVGGVCPSGYHPAKDRSGRCVRNRRMNIANPRALRRSMRRVKGFEKLARKTISFTKRVRIKS